MLTIWKQFRATACAQIGLLGKKEQEAVSREHLAGCQLEKQQCYPLTWVVVVFVEIIH